MVRFTNNVLVRIDFWYKEVNPQNMPGKERKPLCQVLCPLVVPSPTISCKMHATRFGDALLRCRSFSVIVSCCFFMSNPACKTRKLPLLLACRRGRCGVGEDVGPAGIFRLPIRVDAGASPLFPPLDQALIHAMACEVIAETEDP